jgi:hypothetical protein
LEDRRSAPERAQLDADWRALATEALQVNPVWGQLTRTAQRVAIRKYIKKNRTVW